MADEDILNKINQMSEGSVFTGESVQVAGGVRALGKVFEKAGEKAGAAVKSAPKAVIKATKNVLETRKNRPIQPSIVPKKSLKEEAQAVKATENSVEDAKAQEVIDENTESLETVIEPPIDEVLQPEPLSGENVAPAVDTVEQVIAPAPAEKLIPLEQNMAKEPVILPEELSAQIKKSEEELSAVVDREALLPPNQVFNLARNGDIAPALDAITKLAKIDTKTITHEDVLAQVKKRGLDDDFIQRLTGGKIDVSPENSMKVLLAEEWSAKQLDEIGAKVLAGTASTDEMFNAVKAISFNSLVLRSVKGYKTNIAQSFGVLGIQMPDAKIFETSIDGLKSQEDLVGFFDKYFAVKNNPNAQIDMIDAIATGKTNRFLGVLVSGMVSGPGTIVRILGGDIPRLGLRPVETLGASAIGSVRAAIKLGASNRRYGQEAISQILSFDKGFSNGLKAASYAWTNKVSGIERNINRLEIKIRPDFFDINPESMPISKAILGAYNFAASYGGRSVLTVSEFMKGMHYQMGLESLATRRGLEAQQLAIDLGKNEDEAFAAYQQANRDVFANPPDDVIDDAKYWTLESRPEKGSASDILQRFTSHDTWWSKAAKIKMPFINTPVNDMVQALERTPALAIIEGLKATGEGILKSPAFLQEFQSNLSKLSKKIMNDIHSGDYMTRDMALTRVGIGSGVIATAAGLAADGHITGAGPKDKVQRQRMMEQGWMPFSIVKDISGDTPLTEEERTALAESKFGKSFKYSFGSGEYAGKMYVSHTGMSTFSVLSAMGATYNENAQDLEDDDLLGMAAVASFGAYEYILNYPALQAISGLDQYVRNFGQSTEKATAKIVNDFATWATTTLGDMVVPASGARDYFERNLDPAINEYPIDPDMEVGLAGLMRGWNEMTYGIAGEKTIKRNMFNEEQKVDYPGSPIKFSVGKDSEAVQILILSGASSKKPLPIYNITMPIDVNGEPINIPISVKMSDKEYLEYLRIANDPKDKGGLDMKQQILNLKDNPYWLNGNAEARRNNVESIIENSFAQARDILYKDDSEIGVKLRKRIDDAAFAKRLELQRPTGVPQ
jgi:hypothetical protein